MSNLAHFFKENINKILLGIIALIVVLVVTVSIIAFSEKSLAHKYRKTDPQPETVGKIKLSDGSSQKQAAFTQLGQLRIPLELENADGSRSTLVVSPWFAYPEDDSAFFEEINAKSRKIKAIISDYFIHKSRDQLLSSGEPKIKEELLNYINTELILGRISAVYFNEYLFLD